MVALRDNKLIYLASPYSHHLPNVVDEHFNLVCIACAKLMKMGAFVYSPIAHTHPVAMVGELPTDWTFWEAYDTLMLEACGELWVLTLPGWTESKGVTAEIEIMSVLGKPIYYVSPETIESDKLMIDELRTL